MNIVVTRILLSARGRDVRTIAMLAVLVRRRVRQRRGKLVLDELM